MKLLLTSILAILSLTVPTTKTVYDFKVKDIDGKEISLDAYKGKVLLIVNVASMCGYTPQYKDLEALYQTYKDKGLVVVGFPANNFMGQEPGSDKEIKQFCTREFAVTFPMFSKISVKGKNMAPLYKYLTKKSENGTLDADVKWNFQKFLIGRKGEIIQSVAPGTSVNDAAVKSVIEKALKEN